MQATRAAFYRPRTRLASLDLSQPPSVTLLAGPTASGKSALALKMARENGAVIVNADSQQLYADLRILTARPSPAEEAQADHRLYGVVDAAEAWSVGKWSRATVEILSALRDQGRPAIVVGGTGLYFMALTRGLADIPPFERRARNGRDGVHGSGRTGLSQPIGRCRCGRRPRHRTGRPAKTGARHERARRHRPRLSDWKAATRPLLEPGAWTGLVIEPERQNLYDNCDRRVDTMMDQGVLAEVERLLARHLDPALPAMKAVGLRELAAYLGGQTKRQDAVAALKQATRNYAKRQLTWFRNQTADWRRV